MWCPRCGKQGKILKWRIRFFDVTRMLWSCGECDAAWVNPSSISKDNLGQDFDCLVKEKYGIDKSKSEMTILGDFWLVWYNKSTQKFVGKSKLKIEFEEPRHFTANNRLVIKTNLQGIELEDLLQAFGFAEEKKNPTINLYDSVLTLQEKNVGIFQRCSDVKIDLDKYYYFVEFDSEVDGKIIAEDENYPAVFRPRLGLEATDRK